MTEKVTREEIAALGERVAQFAMLELPGQPQAMHMGTSYLVNDLWRTVRALAASQSRPSPDNGWLPIESYGGADRENVDLWLHIYASPRSMGMSDSFRAIECWRENDKWFHVESGKVQELYSDYITHWRPLPPSPAQTEE